MKRTPILIILLIALFISVESYFLFSTVVKTDQGIIYELKPGTSKQQVLTQLHEQQIISHPIFFVAFVYPQNSKKLKFGEYFFPKGSTFYSIWHQLVTGKGQIYYPFTIIPGWTFKEVRQALSESNWAEHNTKDLDDKQIMTQLGFPNILPEGEFFPETYYYTKGVTDLTVLKRACKLMQKKLNNAWEKRANDLPYQNIYQALIAASLIEKEAYLSNERPIIAGVLVNRLRKDMLLQFDPSVIYGMGDRYIGKIHKEDLQADTPFNTYLHKGLPPTPIAMPSMSSINAALHPVQHDYYYFVAKGNGAHQFSKSLNEHNAAVKAAIKPQAFYFNDYMIRYYLMNVLLKNNLFTMEM